MNNNFEDPNIDESDDIKIVEYIYSHITSSYDNLITCDNIKNVVEKNKNSKLTMILKNQNPEMTDIEINCLSLSLLLYLYHII